MSLHKEISFLRIIMISQRFESCSEADERNLFIG